MSRDCIASLGKLLDHGPIDRPFPIFALYEHQKINEPGKFGSDGNVDFVVSRLPNPWKLSVS